MAYATQTAVENILGRSLTEKEAAGFAALQAAVDAYINGETGRNWTAPAEATRYYDVERSRLLDVDAFTTGEDKPVEVFYVDADENKIGSNIDESDYEARPRNEVVKTWLHRRSGGWGSGCPSNVANLAVKAYFGGDVPADIAYAASWLSAQAIGAQSSLSLKSESIEGYSRTFADATKSNTLIQTTLDRYREVLIG